MTISAESLLIRSNRVVDPFNRLCLPISPTLAVIEFCQKEGPRPLSVVSLNQKSFLDMDALSVWLMSSETASGTVLSIFNQQMAIHALSYHCTIYDIQARAFQRPLCISYLSSEKPTGELISRFTDSVRKLLTPLIICNRRLFLRLINDVITISDDIDHDTVHSYYTLNGEELESFQKNHKLANMADMARKLRPRMMSMYEDLRAVQNVDSECEGHSTSDEKSTAEQTFESFRTASTLEPISDLTPCAYSLFLSSLRPLLCHLSSSKPRKGVLYSAGLPILRLPKYESPLKGKEFTERIEEAKSMSEETLKTLCPHLDNLLFPILCSEDVIVAGSVQRKSTVLDLVEKFHSLQPKSHFNHPLCPWTDKLDGSARGIVGVACTRSESTAICASNGAVLDTNYSLLRTVPYRGKLLADFHRKRSFPTDMSLLLFVAASLSRLCLYVYLSRHVSSSAFKAEEMLSDDDELVLANLLTEVDLVKYQEFRNSIAKQRKRATVKNISFECNKKEVNNGRQSGTDGGAGGIESHLHLWRYDTQEPAERNPPRGGGVVRPLFHHGRLHGIGRTGGPDLLGFCRRIHRRRRRRSTRLRPIPAEAQHSHWNRLDGRCDGDDVVVSALPRPRLRMGHLQCATGIGDDVCV